MFVKSDVIIGCLTHGDSQSIVRDSLSASSLQFGNLLSDGKVEKLEEKLSEGLRLTLAFIKQRDISTYHHEIQQARDNLRKDVLELLRQLNELMG